MVHAGISRSVVITVLGLTTFLHNSRKVWIMFKWFQFEDYGPLKSVSADEILENMNIINAV